MILTKFLMFTYLMFLHLLADFFFQSREMGKQKSSKPLVLLAHGSIHFFTFAIGAILPIIAMISLGILLGDKTSYLALAVFPSVAIMLTMLSAINAVLHIIVDACTWNVYKLFKYRQLKKQVGTTENGVHKPKQVIKDQIKAKSKDFKYYEDPWFYHTIGIDQFLHVVCMMAVYGYILFGCNA